MPKIIRAVSEALNVNPFRFSNVILQVSNPAEAVMCGVGADAFSRLISRSWFSTGRTVSILGFGAPGVGKSQAVYEAADVIANTLNAVLLLPRIALVDVEYEFGRVCDGGGCREDEGVRLRRLGELARLVAGRLRRLGAGRVAEQIESLLGDARRAWGLLRALFLKDVRVIAIYEMARSSIGVRATLRDVRLRGVDMFNDALIEDMVLPGFGSLLSDLLFDWAFAEDGRVRGVEELAAHMASVIATGEAYRPVVRSRLDARLVDVADAVIELFSRADEGGAPFCDVFAVSEDVELARFARLVLDFAMDPDREEERGDTLVVGIRRLFTRYPSVVRYLQRLFRPEHNRELEEAIGTREALPLVIARPEMFGDGQRLRICLFHVVDIRLGQVNLDDIKGLPTDAKYRFELYQATQGLKTPLSPRALKAVDTRLVWLSPPWILKHPVLGILFLDELNQAPSYMMAAAYRIVLDRSLSTGEKLSSGVTVVAAGNPPELAPGVSRDIPEPLRDRFLLYWVDPDPEGFVEWAKRSLTGNPMVGTLFERATVIRPDAIKAGWDKKSEEVQDSVKMPVTLRRIEMLFTAMPELSLVKDASPGESLATALAIASSVASPSAAISSVLATLCGVFGHRALSAFVDILGSAKATGVLVGNAIADATERFNPCSHRDDPTRLVEEYADAVFEAVGTAVLSTMMDLVNEYRMAEVGGKETQQEAKAEAAPSLSRAVVLAALLGVAEPQKGEESPTKAAKELVRHAVEDRIPSILSEAGLFEKEGTVPAPVVAKTLEEIGRDRGKLIRLGIHIANRLIKGEGRITIPTNRMNRIKPKLDLAITALKNHIPDKKKQEKPELDTLQQTLEKIGATPGIYNELVDSICESSAGFGIGKKGRGL